MQPLVLWTPSSASQLAQPGWARMLEKNALHDDLWAGVDRKLRNAEFHFAAMCRSLDPPERSRHYVVQESAGASLGNDWQGPFYAHLDAFLSTGRSVGEVIKCSFGVDVYPAAKKWLSALNDPKQCAARNEFWKQFKPHYDAFQGLVLAKARHISEHRKGYPEIEIVVHGILGIVYRGDPITPIPQAERRQIPDPDLSWMKPKEFRLQPTRDDFTIGGVCLFDACGDYIKAAQNLVVEARRIADIVHRNNVVTPPAY